MIAKLRALIHAHYDLLAYLFFGVLTTLVNWVIYYPLFHRGISATVSTILAWVGSVAFAFLTNKPFVFRSHDWSAGVVYPELVKFVSCRLGSGGIETAVMFLTVDFLGWNGNIMKLVVSVLVVILNYVGSKLLVFRK